MGTDSFDNRLKVLHIVNKWAQGGVERFVEGIVAECSGDEIEHAILSVCTDVKSEVECATYGPLYGGAGMLPMWLGSRRLDGFLRDRRYDAVHVHTNNSSGFLYSRIASAAGVGHRIVHSHNTNLGAGSGPIKYAAQWSIWKRYGGSETMRLACSTEAGRHLFHGSDFRVIPNGIDTDRFSFNEIARRELRHALGVDDGCLLVGCVGALISAKNHERALSIFHVLLQDDCTAKLLILGDGELRQSIEAEARAKGIREKLIMPGFVEDAHFFYSAMDALLFPSLYEGLPIALVEAQCNGLPVVCSDSITHEVALTDSFTQVSLGEDDKAWASKLETAKRDMSGTSAKVVRAKGFDRQTTVKLLSEIYEGLASSG